MHLTLSLTKGHNWTLWNPWKVNLIRPFSLERPTGSSPIPLGHPTQWPKAFCSFINIYIAKTISLTIIMYEASRSLYNNSTSSNTAIETWSFHIHAIAHIHYDYANRPRSKHILGLHAQTHAKEHSQRRRCMYEDSISARCMPV